MSTPSTRMSARAIADVSTGLILASVEITVPPERVFRSLASEEIATWWGSEDMYRVTRWTGDVRPGGAWKSEGMGKDGRAFSVSGEYLEVDPPRKLVHTWRYDWDPTRSTTTVSYRLEPLEGGAATRLVVRHEGFDPANPAACADHATGWERVLGWLVGFHTKEGQKR
jgi:uncharacterized protein YndB with AHSA1/START domain